MCSKRVSAAASVFGGKNSKEKVVLWWEKIWLMCMRFRPWVEEGKNSGKLENRKLIREVRMCEGRSERVGSRMVREVRLWQTMCEWSGIVWGRWRCQQGRIGGFRRS